MTARLAYNYSVWQGDRYVFVGRVATGQSALALLWLNARTLSEQGFSVYVDYIAPQVMAHLDSALWDADSQR